MTDNRSLAAASLALFGFVALAYSLLIAAQPLFGLGVFALALAVAYAVATDADRRETAMWAAIGVVVLYGVLTLQFLLTVVAACTIYLTAWVTGPGGPYAE